LKKYCKNLECGYEVDENFKGKCPKCDTVGWRMNRGIIEPSVKVSDFINAELKKIDPKVLANSLKILSQRQDEIRKSMVPLSKIVTPKMMEQMFQINKRFKTLNFDKIKIPQFSFNIDAIQKQIKEDPIVDLSADAILVKASEINPELKEAVESKKEIENADKKLNDISEQLSSLQKTTNQNFKDVGDKQDEHHIEQMAEHEKTRDDLLIDNGKLQEKIDTLMNKVSNGWKDPKNWTVGFIISIIAGLLMLTVQYFS